MAQRDFNKLGNIQAAMDTLRMYNSFVLFPAIEEILQNPALEVYFNSPLDAPVERKVEKIICAAAIRAVYKNPNIPQMNKERSAKATVRGLRAAMQIAKLELKASSNELTAVEYMRRKRSNIIVKKAAKVKMAKKLVKNVSITALAGAVAGPIGASVAVGTRIIGHFLPDKIKEPIQKTAKEGKEMALEVIENTVDYIKSISVGKAVQKAIDAVKPIVTTVVDSAKKVYTKAKDFVKSFLSF